MDQQGAIDSDPAKSGNNSTFVSNISLQHGKATYRSEILLKLSFYLHDLYLGKG